MAIGTPILPTNAEYFSNADSNSYTTDVITSAGNYPTFVGITSGRTDALAEVPSSVSGMGLTWSLVGDIAGNGNNFRLSVYRSSGTPTNGALTVNFTTMMMNFESIVVQVPGVLGSAPVIQYDTGTGGGTSPLDMTLPSALTTGSAALVFAAIAASTQSLTPSAGDGYTDFGSHNLVTSPVIQFTVAYNLSPTSTNNVWESDGTAGKAGLIMELAASPVSTPDNWTYKRFARLG